MNFLQLLTVVIPLAFWNMLFTMYTIKRETKEINIKLKTLERNSQNRNFFDTRETKETKTKLIILQKDIDELFSFFKKQKIGILAKKKIMNENFFDINTNRHQPIDILDTSNPPDGGSGLDSGTYLSNKLTYSGAIFKIDQLKRREELELEGALEKYEITAQKIMEETKKEIDKIMTTPLKPE